MSEITLKTLVVRFKWQILLTNLLVFIESILGVLIPLFIGLAINDLLDQSFRGVIYLIVVGLSSVAVGSIRRVYDTRTYSQIYQIVAPEMVAKEQKKDSSVSKVIARTSLLAEIVEFLEWSVPAVVGAAVYLIAILVIIATLNLNVFYASLALLLLILIVYAMTGKINFKLNENYNDQLENEVNVLETKDHSVRLRIHCCPDRTT
jgi:ABC-type bacteriocin/lantibiotic exporter with double-glycine peptidase domain